MTFTFLDDRILSNTALMNLKALRSTDEASSLRRGTLSCLAFWPPDDGYPLEKRKLAEYFFVSKHRPLLPKAMLASLSKLSVFA